jgi:Ca-activated chloride channel family protein
MFFSFAYPYLLLLLSLGLCFVWCKPPQRPFYVSKLSWVPLQSHFWHPLLWLKVLLFSLMVVSLAVPFSYTNHDLQTQKGRDIVIAIDASGSMAQSGFGDEVPFDSKFKSAIALTQTFVKQRFSDNVGVVLFGTFAFSASPLTYDLNALAKMLHYPTVGLAGENTAMGDAIVEALRVLSFGHAKQRVVVLLTDGFHNAGKHSPHDAVKLAKAHQVKIYTIGLGETKAFDAPLLEKIAQETGGESYKATKAKDLENVYETIDNLEPSDIPKEAYLNKEVLGDYPLMGVWVILLLWYLREVK